MVTRRRDGLLLLGPLLLLGLLLLPGGLSQYLLISQRRPLSRLLLPWRQLLLPRRLGLLRPLA
jgi:hypothetical protein